MNRNRALWLLMAWCDEKTKVSAACRWSWAMDEMRFKLSTLVDRPFRDDADFRGSIRALLDVHPDPMRADLENALQARMVQRFHDELLAYTDRILSERESLPVPDLPYERVILGEEAEGIIARFDTVWRYRADMYWYPLCGDHPAEVPDKFFVMSRYVKPHWQEICRRIGVPGARVYSYGHSAYNWKFCKECAVMEPYYRAEHAYSDTDFTWIIAFSHEDTTAFAGAAVPIVKEILQEEKAHWNRYEG